MRPQHWQTQSTGGEGLSPDRQESMDPDSPDGCNGSGTSSNGGRARQRLKPWLEAQINSGRFPGVEWVDQAEGLFRISWKHGGRADWSEQDGLIFKEWAIHTGRYREGTDNPDWPSWKTRLRCALNKLPDIQEQKELSCYDEPHPFRVYKFVDKRVTGSGSTSPTQQQQQQQQHHHHHHHHHHEQQPAPQPMMCDDDSCSYGGPPDLYQSALRPSVIQPNLPNIIPDTLDSDGPTHNQEACGGETQGPLGSLRSLENIKDLLPINTNMSLTNISIDSNINSCPVSMDTDSLKGASCHPIKPEPHEAPDAPYYQASIDDHRLTLEIRYRRQIIKSMSLSEVQGCRVYYGNLPHISAWSPEKYGSREAEQICVPYTHGQLEVRQDNLTTRLLNALELGIDIYVEKGNVYIYRRCKASVYVAPANKVMRETVKVERDQPPLKIFDFSNDFLNAFMHYQQGEGPPPSPSVIIAIGQNYHTEQEPYTNLLLSVTVYHPQASHLMSHVPQNHAVAISHPEYTNYTDYATANSATIPAAQPMPLYSTNAAN